MQTLKRIDWWQLLFWWAWCINWINLLEHGLYDTSPRMVLVFLHGFGVLGCTSGILARRNNNNSWWPIRPDPNEKGPPNAGTAS